MLEEELKTMIVEGLNLKDVKPEQIGDDTPLFGEGIGLDSLDAVELVVLLQRKYGLKITGLDKSREALQSVRTLAAFIRDQKAQA